MISVSYYPIHLPVPLNVASPVVLSQNVLIRSLATVGQPLGVSAAELPITKLDYSGWGTTAAVDYSLPVDWRPKRVVLKQFG